MRHYRVSLRGEETVTLGVVAAKSRGQARYNMLLRVRDCLPDVSFASLVVRPENDVPDPYGYVRETYGVPAKVGHPVRLPNGHIGVVVYAPESAHVAVACGSRVMVCHPNDLGWDVQPTLEAGE